MDTKQRQKILVYLIGSLGDTIVAIPALRAVRRHFPEAEIVLLQNTQPGNVVTASQVIPKELIDRSLDYTSNSGSISSYFGLWKKLRAERFDAAIYLVISERPERSARRDRLFFSLCRIKHLIGFHAFTAQQLYPTDPSGHPAETEHEALKKLARLENDGISISRAEAFRLPLFDIEPSEREEMQEWLGSQRNKPDLPLLALAPGCKTPANAWPTENFTAIAKMLIEQHACEILIVGGPAETKLGDELVTELGCGINAAGKFDVRGSTALLSLCDLYFGLDTGTTHLAASVGTPCVALFHERDNPGQWFPLGDGHTILQHDVSCAGCRVHECPVVGHPCMNGIPVEPVFNELMKRLRPIQSVSVQLFPRNVIKV